MKGLLDTHTIIYAAAAPELLGKNAKAFLINRDNILYASLASLWEIIIKTKLGKLELPTTAEKFWIRVLEKSQFNEIVISRKAILRSGELDLHHRDPFDRILAAQALEEGIAFISQDAAVDSWGVDRIW